MQTKRDLEEMVAHLSFVYAITQRIRDHEEGQREHLQVLFDHGMARLNAVLDALTKELKPLQRFDGKVPNQVADELPATTRFALSLMGMGVPTNVLASADLEEFYRLGWVEVTFAGFEITEQGLEILKAIQSRG